MCRPQFPEPPKIFSVQKRRAFALAVQVQERIRRLFNVYGKLIECRNTFLILAGEINLIDVVQLQAILLPAGVEVQVQHEAAFDALALCGETRLAP